jgi:hypothetical protein
LTNNVIDREQYTVLVTVVIGSAVVPTLIAQAFFRPAIPAEDLAVTASPLPSEVPEHGILQPAKAND